MGAAGERKQEVDGHGAVSQPAARGDLLAQVLRGENANRPETAGGRYGPGEFVPGETTAHPRLDDRQIQPESVQENAHWFKYRRDEDGRSGRVRQPASVSATCGL